MLKVHHNLINTFVDFNWHARVHVQFSMIYYDVDMISVILLKDKSPNFCRSVSIHRTCQGTLDLQNFRNLRTNPNPSLRSFETLRDLHTLWAVQPILIPHPLPLSISLLIVGRYIQSHIEYWDVWCSIFHLLCLFSSLSRSRPCSALSHSLITFLFLIVPIIFPLFSISLI